MTKRKENWAKFLAAILLGNALYLFLTPYLPASVRHQREYRPDLGTLVDFWLCLFVYGLLELVSLIRERGRRPPRG